jgi:hypothetical protein
MQLQLTDTETNVLHFPPINTTDINSFNYGGRAYFCITLGGRSITKTENSCNRSRFSNRLIILFSHDTDANVSHTGDVSDILLN